MVEPAKKKLSDADVLTLLCKREEVFEKLEKLGYKEGKEKDDLQRENFDLVRKIQDIPPKQLDKVWNKNKYRMGKACKKK